MKYMIMMFGDQATMMETRSPEWIKNMMELMHKLDGELRESGEFVDGQGLADPTQAKTVRIQDGIPVATDGPFAEAKESLAGYWIVDVSEDRAIEIASRVVASLGRCPDHRRRGAPHPHPRNGADRSVPAAGGDRRSA